MTIYPGISIYNQARLSDENFVEAFVVRLDLLELLLNILRRQADGGESEHQIIVGSRGMGKSTLLRRVAIGIKRDEKLAAHFVPLQFREEQYNVIALAAFWRNCGESLAEWCEANGHQEIADRLDSAIETTAWRDAETAVAAFLETCREIGRRPVLLVDNLDLIVNALPPLDQWALRRILQMPDGPVLIGAATQLLTQSGERDAAFYEFFHPHLLEPLTEAELFQCMHALADLRQEAGAPVKRLLAREPERLRTLYTLTGGNPRVLALIYQLIERSDSETIFTDLESLLDQVTPFYKARVEEYATAQQRAVIDAIALHWDPISSHDIGRAAGIEVTTVSSHLNRLRKDGFVQEVASSGARSSYQIAERFLNIWYLMRHGTRRARQKLRWLTIFLSRWYSPEELGRMADEARGDTTLCRWHPDYREAVIAAWEEVTNGYDISLVSRFEMASKFVVQGDYENALVVLDEVLSLSISSEDPAVRMGVALALTNKGWALNDLGRREEAIVVWDEAMAYFDTWEVPSPEEVIADTLLKKGWTHCDLDRPEEAIATWDEVVSRFGTSQNPALAEKIAEALVNKGFALDSLGRYEQSIAAFDEAIGRFGASEGPPPLPRNSVARALIGKALCLYALSRHKEAIAASEEVIARFGASEDSTLRDAVAEALTVKGLSLEELDQRGEAIVVWEQAIARFFNDSLVCAGTTESAHRREQVFLALNCKGNILCDHYGSFSAAEISYRDALRFDETSLFAKVNLAWLLLTMSRPAEARAYRAELTDLAPIGLALLDAGIALATDNFGAAVDHLGVALDDDLRPESSNFFDDLLRFLRLVHSAGYGEKLIAWFETSGNADRYAPIHAAFIAYVRGERFLLDVNPEVRRPARMLFDRLDRPRKHAEGGDPAPVRKPARRARRRKPA